MDLMSLANNNLQHALNEWVRAQIIAIFQALQEPVLNHQVYSVTSAESPLLHPFDLTHHCDYIGEPLTPTLPCLRRPWREKYNAYIEKGYSLERLLEVRRSSWRSYLSHNDEDFKCLLMDIYVDDYNQRLLNIRKIEEAKKQLKREEQAKKVYPTANFYGFEQVQGMTTFPLLANFGMVYRCEDIEASLKATINQNMEVNKNNNKDVTERLSKPTQNVHDQSSDKNNAVGYMRRSSTPLVEYVDVTFNYEDIEELHTPTHNQRKEENCKPSERSTNLNVNVHNTRIMDIPNMNNFVNQQQHQQQPRKKNKRNRRRRNRNRNRKYHRESPMNAQQQTEVLQPIDNQHHFAHVVEPPQASSPMFPSTTYQIDLKAWMEYLRRPPFYYDRSPFYGEVNDYNQCLRNFNQIYPYLQNVNNMNMYTY